MIKTSLINPRTGERIHTERVYDGFQPARTDPDIFITASYQDAHGVFKTTTRTSAGTTQLVVPNDGQSIVLTDFILSTDKQQSGTVALRFTDGTNTAAIVSGSVSDAPLNLAHTFRGRFQGWADARIDFVTAGATFNANVAVGYIRLPSGLPYAEWNALR